MAWASALAGTGPIRQPGGGTALDGAVPRGLGELSADPVELVDAGEKVVALVHMSGRGRGSGVEVRGGVDVHVMRFREGEVSYFRIYPGNFLIDEAGLSEQEFELLILRVQEGLDMPEIARRGGISESDAQAMLDRIHELLRNLPGGESAP